MTEQTPLPLDLDTLLGGFPGYIKSEYTYEDSGFGTDNHKPDDLLMSHHLQHPHQHQHQHGAGVQSQHMVGQHPHSPLAAVTGNPSNTNSTNLGAFHDPNNNSSASSSNNSSSGTNDWQMTDHNAEVRPVMSLLILFLTRSRSPFVVPWLDRWMDGGLAQ